MTVTLTHPQLTHDTSSRHLAIAARAVDATKLYGKGEAEVRALEA
jgi:hypothetical protein